MKRFLALFLSLITVLPLVSCATLAPLEKTEETVEAPRETVSETEETYPKITSPLTWERIQAIPVATQEMTVDELRQICVDYMRLMLSFRWTPDRTLAYRIETEMHNNKPMEFQKGTVFAGIPYRAGTNAGSSGNLYTFMEIYDPESGVLRTEGLTTDQVTAMISNHCSSSCYWAWSRVINTMQAYSLKTERQGLVNGRMVKSCGFLPVGPYTYGNVSNWSDGDGTRAVAEANGAQVMFASYAAVRPADGCIQLYPKNTTHANHVRMFATRPEVAYLPDGTIDGDNSFAVILEQGSSPTRIVDEDGTEIFVEGGIDRRVSFRTLYEHSYLPFTFAEFLGTDPVEKATVTFTSKKGEDVTTLEGLRFATLDCNYPISSVTVTATDASGKEIYRRNAHPGTIGTFSYDLYLSLTLTVLSMEKKGNRIRITTRVGTGEEFVLYTTN